jgi:hypothetical protein
LRPVPLDPARDGLVVAFGRSACGSRPGPAQLLAQDGPDACWVVAHPSHPLDHLSHAVQGPHVGGVAVGLGTFGQRDPSTRSRSSGLSFGSRPARPAARSPSRPDRRHLARQSDTIWWHTPNCRAISAGPTPRSNRSAARIRCSSRAWKSRRGRARRPLDAAGCCRLTARREALIPQFRTPCYSLRGISQTCIDEPRRYRPPDRAPATTGCCAGSEADGYPLDCDPGA